MRNPIFALILIISGSMAFSADPPKLTPEQQATAKERKELEDEVRRLLKEGNFKDAIPILQKVLIIERKVFGEAHTEALGTMQVIATFHDRVEDFASAQKTWAELVELRTTAFGKGNWRVIDAQLALQNSKIVEKLTSENRKQLSNADKLNDDAIDLFDAGKYSDAIPLHEACAKIRKDLLGIEHPRYAMSLNNLAQIHEYRGQNSKAEPIYLEAARLRKVVLGEKHPDYALSLFGLANVYQAMYRTAKAEQLYLDAIRITKDAYGEAHPSYAVRLNGLASLYQAQGRYADAERLYLDVQRITKAAKGEKNLSYAAILNNLASLYEARSLFSKAEPLYKEALAIAKELLGEKHPDYAIYVNNLAGLYQHLGRYADSESLYQAAMRILKESLGENHPEYAVSLNNLGYLFEDQGRYTKAEPLYKDALRITKGALGENHPSYAMTLNNLANLYKLQSRFTEAESNYLDAVRIRKATLGENHRNYGTSLSSIATLYAAQGRYAKAEPLALEALRIDRNALGEMHPDYALSKIGLASLYEKQGQYVKAEALLADAVRILKEALGDQHPKYSLGMNNLASVYLGLGQLSKAESMLLEVVRIRKETLTENHPNYAVSLNNLAEVYRMQSQYTKAEPLYLESLRIRKTLGEKHPDYARGLNNLAGLYQSQGQNEKAEPLFSEALRIMKESLGEKHPQYALALNNLALLHSRLGQHAKAEVPFHTAVTILQNLLEESAMTQSEADQLQHVGVSRFYLNNYLNLPETDTAALYSIVFRWHGAVTARQTFARIASRSSPEIRGTIAELGDVSRQMNQLVQNPPKTMAKAEQVKAIKELDDQREVMEKKLASQSQDFAAYQSQRKFTPADLQKCLPNDTALIDFLIHGETTSAFIVTNQSITRIKLETGKEFGEELATYRGATSLMRTRPVNDEDDDANKLRARIWEPLEPQLKGIKRVLICPDGLFCRLPFAALPGADPKKYLLEELSIVVVPVPQLLPTLLAADVKKFSGATSLLAVGDVDFDGDPAAGEKLKPLPVALTRSGDGLSWKPLPNTKGEVEVVGSLFSKLPQATVQKLLGGDATEAALERELTRHRYIHLATHGFFAAPKMVRQFKDDQSASGEQVLLPSIPPGLSSGIVCAGANKPTFQTSGVLTATQIAELDLRNVELAVLSACETSLGTLSGGEGVLGLQRAFQMAGARSTITTMWAVYDQSTAELMKRMYSNRLENGLAAAEALREAQLWVLNNGDKVGAFDTPPRAGKRTPPKYWAAFGFSGDWR